MSDATTITVQDVMNLPDIRSVMDFIKVINKTKNPDLPAIDTKGIKNIKDAKDRVCQWIVERDRDEQVPPLPEIGLGVAIEEDAEKRRLLTQKYQQAQCFYDKLPDNYKKDLNQVFPGIGDAFEEKTRTLRKSDCAILVAGEKAAGKSSLINLLLDVDLLPTSELGASIATCEFRKSEQDEKYAYVYHRKDPGEHYREKVKVDLSKSENLQVLRNFVIEEDEDGDSPYDRIEVYWPFKMMEEGLVIIDTPGIGGGTDMTRIVDKYLSKSFGFIYVINTTAAGGVARDRLQSFLRLVINNAGEDVEFTPESTLFVANKWENIPEENKEDLKKDIERKLGRAYPAFKRSQMCYISIKRALEMSKYGAYTKEYEALLDGIQRLLPETLRGRLNGHYRWLSSVLKRSMYSLKMSRTQLSKSKSEKEAEFKKLSKQMKELEENAQDRIKSHKTSISTEAVLVTHAIVEAMRSKEMAECLFVWDSKDCPQGTESKKITRDAMEKITARITLAVNAWDKKQSIIHGIKDKLVRAFKRDFALMEDQMSKLEAVLLGGDQATVTDLIKTMRRQAPIKQIWKQAKSDRADGDSVKGLGGVVVSASNVNVRQIKDIFRGYNNKKDQQTAQAKMAKATEHYIANIIKGTVLKERVSKYFQKFLKDIDQVAKIIPEFLKADRQMMEMLLGEIEGHKRIEEILPGLLQESLTLQSNLDIFFVHHIMKFDYTQDEIDWTEEVIGKGSFADVYFGTLRAQGRVTEVALKVCLDPVKKDTVSDILLEDRIMRDLDHENIVKYFGASFRWMKPKKQEGLQWVMVIERCQGTLKREFIDGNNAGKYDDGSGPRTRAMKTMAVCALQILNGLRYIHGKGYVHRDLKLENILVDDENVIKLADVGVAKKAVDITHTKAGSPVYMAPEVLLQTQKCDHKADIYSLGIMLWEMWYGIDAADHIAPQLTRRIEAEVEKGLRPSVTLRFKPPQDWLALITSSWESDSNQRPDTDVHIKFFKDFLHRSK